jgi:hypothetical protein
MRRDEVEPPELLALGDGGDGLEIVSNRDTCLLWHPSRTMAMVMFMWVDGVFAA